MQHARSSLRGDLLLLRPRHAMLTCARARRTGTRQAGFRRARAAAGRASTWKRCGTRFARPCAQAPVARASPFTKRPCRSCVRRSLLATTGPCPAASAEDHSQAIPSRSLGAAALLRRARLMRRRTPTSPRPLLCTPGPALWARPRRHQRHSQRTARPPPARRGMTGPPLPPLTCPLPPPASLTPRAARRSTPTGGTAPAPWTWWSR